MKIETLTQPVISQLGSRAMLFEAPGVLSLENQQRIWALSTQVKQWPWVAEAVPGMNNLMLTFHQPPEELEPLYEALQAEWLRGEAQTLEGRVIELPVYYGGEYGPHICDVAEYTGLSIAEIVRRHAQPQYPVYALGSHPGYCYLGGMDPAIATPRRQTPVMSIPGGAVSIGGVQTGVSASAGPSGWNTIGHTEYVFFNAAATPPVMLRPGDSLQFRVKKVLS
ncbi:5-oxoprolinase subunit PxpB [Rouxiella sp. WC2420]|uniref:5-oxoprolinase subunit PxpB n=1 Tax=Rouxiella sp. WC2420 TaxID=3234145 RepID=A0AB39VLI0_9GAMM